MMWYKDETIQGGSNEQVFCQLCYTYIPENSNRVDRSEIGIGDGCSYARDLTRLL